MCKNYLKNTISCAKTKCVLDGMLIPTMSATVIITKWIVILSNGMVFPVILPWMKGFLKSEIGISFLPAPSA